MTTQRFTNRGTANILASCLFDKILPQAGSVPGGPVVRALTLLLAKEWQNSAVDKATI